MEMCNISEAEDVNKTTTNMGEMENVRICKSPVFKCVNHTKPARENNLDSSDYDIPSYQVNQLEKSVTSSKYDNETNESVLPFTPVLSPMSVAPKVHFQPPSTHTVGTVAKNLDKPCQSKVNSRKETSGIFDGLRMTDKDISWASSMATPPPKQVPGSEFNTIEKATFFPEEKFHNIQPRALFSPPLDDDFGCQPIVFTSESDDGGDDEEYKSNIRLSDVCATLKQLEFKSSLDQAPDSPVEKVVNEEPGCASPVIKVKKKSESVKKKKKGCLVVSPVNRDKYEFSVNVKGLDCEKLACSDSNFLDDDSFQSLSFTCLDELCRTLVSSQNDSSVASSDKTVISTSIIKKKQNILKKFYSTKGSTDVYTVSSMDNLHSYVKALEEGDSCIPQGKKIDQTFPDKGIVSCNALTKDSCKVDATKRLHSEVTGGNDECREKKLKKVDDEWENVKQYLSESQLNVSDGEIFRTVENLEKTLASQENKELEKPKAVGSQGERPSAPENSTLLCAENSEKNKDGGRRERGTNEVGACGTSKPDAEETAPFGETSELKISKNQKLNYSGESFEIPYAEHLSGKCLIEGFSDDPINERKILPEALDSESSGIVSTFEEKTSFEGEEKFRRDRTFARSELEKCDGVRKQLEAVPAVMEGFSTCSGKRIHISAKALEKAKALMAQCDENVGEFFKKDFGENSGEQKLFSKSDASGEKLVALPSGFLEGFSTTGSKQTPNTISSEKPKQKSSVFKGFSTGSGKTVRISAEALEKAKMFMINCDREFRENSNQFESPWVGELLNQTFEGKTKTADDDNEKPRTSAENCGKLKPDDGVSSAKVEPQFVGFVTAGGSKVTISESALAKAKQRMNEWEQIKPEDSGNFDCFTDTRPKSEGRKHDEGHSKLSTTPGFDETDDWDEIIPNWLHVYHTSPSIASDRTELSPMSNHEDGRTTSEGQYIVKSPVLGTGDRFQGRRRKLRFQDEKKAEKKNSFVAVTKNSEGRGKAKRSLSLSVDFSVPFKKSKFAEEVTADVGVDVKARRARAREEQERIIGEKQKEKMVKGSHLNRKCSEKQISWMEAVKGGSPQVHAEEILTKFGINEAVLKINIETALSVRLKGEDFFGSDCTANATGIPVGDGCLLILDDENKFGVEEVKRAFLASPGVQPNLLPAGWVENHYKWIIWKLAHYERSFPQFFLGCLTPGQILVQLKYRYDREIDRNERSSLKKILERDDTSVKRLVLCVCGIKKVVVGEAVGYELKLTDGWYCCSARSDPAMVKLIEEGKLSVGTKLLTQGATLVNCEQGASPLEISGDTYLKISTNSTRRVRWDTKLGFQNNPKNFPVSLGSILPQGGSISRIDVIVVRTYPVLYMEKTSDGHHGIAVTRNRRLEEKADAEFRRIQEQIIESIYNEVQSEMKESLRLNENHLNDFEQNEGFGQLMEGGAEPSPSRVKSTSNQCDLFSRELREKVEQKLQKKKLIKRNVSEFLRAKIVDFRKPDYNNPAVLSVWNPNEDLIALLSEGKVVSLMNVTINNSTRIYKPLQINTTRQTQYNRIFRNVKYPARKLTKLKEVSSKVCPAFEEVDVVGLVALIRDISHGSRLSQVVYLTDLDMNFVGVAFWGSCKDYGWENVLRSPSIIACSNLQWKKNYTLQEVPSLYVNENSVFTENPKQNYLREEIERLKQNKPQDMTDFLSKCEESLTAKLEDSKWRPNTGRNSTFGDSTSGDSNFGKTRASFFESKPTASSTPIKPFTVKVKSEEAEPSPIQRRIEKLQCYGEPPPLVPLVVRNNSKKKFSRGGRIFTSR